MDLGLLVLHVVVGLLFVGHGSQKLFGVLGGYGLEGVGAFFETIGLRPGKLNAIAAGTAELLGGALIALGLLVPLGAALLIAVMVAATLTAHRGKGIWNDNGGFELPLVNVAAVFALAAVGAGDISLDAALDLDRVGARRARCGHPGRDRRRRAGSPARPRGLLGHPGAGRIGRARD